jgi:hypothetical protein
MQTGAVRPRPWPPATALALVLVAVAALTFGTAGPGQAAPARSAPAPGGPRITVGTKVRFFVQGASISVRLQLSTTDGPLAGQPVYLRHLSVRSTGDGDLLGPLLTGADGSVTQVVPAADPGWHDFDAEYLGGPADPTPAYSGSVEITVVPPTAPASPDATLTSGDGTYFRTTTVYGHGFQPQSSVTISAYPSPLLLATARADDDGQVAAEIALPDPLSGPRTIVAQGSADGPHGTVLRNLTLQMTVPPAGSAGIGSLDLVGQLTQPHRLGRFRGLGRLDQAMLLTLFAGVFLALAGPALWFVSRRRRIRTGRLDHPSGPIRERQPA